MPKLKHPKENETRVCYGPEQIVRYTTRNKCIKTHNSITNVVAIHTAQGMPLLPSQQSQAALLPLLVRTLQLVPPYAHMHRFIKLT